MGEILKAAKSLMFASVIQKWVFTFVFLMLAFALVFGGGGGGEFTISWYPVGSVENGGK